MKPSEDKKLREIVADKISAFKELRARTDEVINRLERLDFEAFCYDDMATDNWYYACEHSGVKSAFDKLDVSDGSLFNHLKDARDRELFGMTATEALRQQAAKSA